MRHSPAFKKGRAITFFIMTFISLIGIVLLSVVAFARWDQTGHTERTFYALTILANVLNVITLPILILVEFRPWLDVTRMLLLLTVNIGVAVCYVVWYPSFQCPENSDPSLCRSISVSILAFVWAIPILLLFYSICLGILIYTRIHTPIRESEFSFHTAERKNTTTEPNMRHLSITTTTPPLHSSWVATGVPHSPSTSNSSRHASARHSVSPTSGRRTSAPAPAPGTFSEWDSRPRYPGGYPLTGPPMALSPSYASSDPNATFDPYAGFVPPVPSVPPPAVPRPARPASQRFISNRMSHLSELVDVARSDSGSSGEGESDADSERHRRKLAKTSRIYERAVIM